MSRWFQVLFAGWQERETVLKITELIKFNRFLGALTGVTAPLPNPAADDRGKVPIDRCEIRNVRAGSGAGPGAACPVPHGAGH